MMTRISVEKFDPWLRGQTLGFVCILLSNRLRWRYHMFSMEPKGNFKFVDIKPMDNEKILVLSLGTGTANQEESSIQEQILNGVRSNGYLTRVPHL